MGRRWYLVLLFFSISHEKEHLRAFSGCPSSVICEWPVGASHCSICCFIHLLPRRDILQIFPLAQFIKSFVVYELNFNFDGVSLSILYLLIVLILSSS